MKSKNEFGWGPFSSVFTFYMFPRGNKFKENVNGNLFGPVVLIVNRYPFIGLSLRPDCYEKLDQRN